MARYGKDGGLFWLLVYGGIAWILYQRGQPSYAGAPAGGAAPTFWIRSEDNQVAASHTGPPSSVVDPDRWWGTWTPASTAQVQEVLASGGLVTYS